MINTAPIQTCIVWGWLFLVFSRFAGLWGSTEDWSQQQTSVWGCRQNEKNNPVKFWKLINVFKRLNFTWIDQQGNIQSLKSSMVEDVLQFAMDLLKTMTPSWDEISVVISYDCYRITIMLFSFEKKCNLQHSFKIFYLFYSLKPKNFAYIHCNKTLWTITSIVQQSWLIH